MCFMENGLPRKSPTFVMVLYFKMCGAQIMQDVQVGSALAAPSLRDEMGYRKRARKPSAKDRGMNGRSFPEAGRTGWVSTPGARLVFDSAGDLMYT